MEKKNSLQSKAITRAAALGSYLKFLAIARPKEALDVCSQLINKFSIQFDDQTKSAALNEEAVKEASLTLEDSDND